MAYAADSKSADLTVVWVRIPPPVPTQPDDFPSKRSDTNSSTNSSTTVSWNPLFARHPHQFHQKKRYAEKPGVPQYFVESGATFYLLENWNDLRAFLRPGFFRSTILASRVRKVPLRRVTSCSSLTRHNALANPMTTAPT